MVTYKGIHLQIYKISELNPVSDEYPFLCIAERSKNENWPTSIIVDGCSAIYGQIANVQIVVGGSLPVGIVIVQNIVIAPPQCMFSRLHLYHIYYLVIKLNNLKMFFGFCYMVPFTFNLPFFFLFFSPFFLLNCFFLTVLLEEEPLQRTFQVTILAIHLPT